MDEPKTESSNQPKPQSKDSGGDAVKIATSAGGCALCTLVFGTLLGAPWPSAVVACAIAIMGVAIAYIASRR